MSSQYNKTVADDTFTTFDVTPADAPFPLTEFIFLGFLSFIAFLIHAAAGLLIFLILGTLYTFVFWKTPKANRYRSPASFKANSAALIANGVTFPREDIHRLIMRNHVSGAEGELYGNNMAAIQMANKRAKQLAEVSYRVDVESGGKATTLAGGLTEVTAYGLLKDASAVLRFDVK